MDLTERIQSVQEYGSNCVGTALYVAGITPYDIFTTHREIEWRLRGMDKTDDPEIGDLVVFRTSGKGSPIHMGVLVEVNPTLRIFHRHDFKAHTGIDDLNEYHKSLYPHTYLEYYSTESAYIPSCGLVIKLQKWRTLLLSNPG